ncbi:MAG: cytochrome c [Acidobacteriota bacterium]|nr:cytochrome c [Acidobacteriota bacterium]
MEKILKSFTSMSFIALVTIFSTSSCNSDMAKNPAPAPYAGPQEPVEGTLTHHGRLPLDRSQMEVLFPTNPLPLSEKIVEAGRRQFAIYCAPCHGSTGKGDGPVSAKFIPPTDLASPFIQKNTDGWFYGTIRNGVRLMPRYGAELTSDQAWQIVAYMRTFKQN